MSQWGAGKKIFLVGDDGQLGSALLAMSDQTNIFIASDYSLDFADAQACEQILEDVRPEVVVNCAAYTAVDQAEQDSETAFLVNAEGPKLLATWCERNDGHLVHISTDYVFSGAKPLYNSYFEGDSVGPKSVYGQSKLLGEENIKNICSDRYTILRTAWLYGAAGNNFLKTLLRLVLRDPAREYKVVNDQFGSPTSADALSRQIQAVVDNEVFGLCHATSHGHCSWYEFALEFFGRMGLDHRLVPCTTQEYPTAAQRPVNSILANSRLRELELDLFVHWHDDLALFIDSYASQLIEEAAAS